jgi:hypothetical protein
LARPPFKIAAASEKCRTFGAQNPDSSISHPCRGGLRSAAPSVLKFQTFSFPAVPVSPTIDCELDFSAEGATERSPGRSPGKMSTTKPSAVGATLAHDPRLKRKSLRRHRKSNPAAAKAELIMLSLCHG